ncbi:MAG: zinc ribbon domain-containing protein [Aminipila sp.]
MLLSLLPLIILSILGVGVPVLVGLYVYHDAIKRGMDAALWTLIAILVPMLAGFILYMIVRDKHKKIICPNCGLYLETDWSVCPKCGMQTLKNSEI